MSQEINAEIISIGTEILLGELTDTNSVYLARMLRDLGINLFYMTSVGDNKQRIVTALQIAMARADIVITTGGLGPTVDDMTREAVALLTERPLVFHQDLLETISERFRGFKVHMTENNRRQAFLPENAHVIANPVGTAPAFLVEYQGKVIISLPGVPREMKYLVTESVIPWLRDHYQLGVIKAHILRVAGIGESTLDDRLGTDILESANPSIGLAAHSGVIDIRITAKADRLEMADSMIATMETVICERVGEYIFGTGDDTIEDVLAAALRDRDKQIVVVETGLIGAVTRRLPPMLMDMPIIADNFTFERIDDTCAFFALQATLPLRDLALACAEHAASRAGVDVAIAIISNPDRADDQSDQDEGTAVAVWVNGQHRTRAYGFGPQSDIAALWTSTWTLASAWRMLQEQS